MKGHNFIAISAREYCSAHAYLICKCKHITSGHILEISFLKDSLDDSSNMFTCYEIPLAPFMLEPNVLIFLVETKVWFNLPVNIYGHVELVIDSIILFPGPANIAHCI